MDEPATSSESEKPVENGFASHSEIKQSEMSSKSTAIPTPVVPQLPPDPYSECWLDITENFKDAAESLQLGELVHDSSFSLFEGMSAIELMDPKMDAGMIQRCAHQEPVTFSSAVESGKLKLSDIPSAEQIAIMDATMACLLTWLEGHSLAQTVFTNLYTHKPYDIECRPLKAYIVAIIKLIAICGDVVRRVYIWEEEDFQPTNYGFSLCNELSETRVLGMLKEADDDCQKTIRHLKGKSATDDPQTTMEHMEAVSLRLRFLRYLITTIMALTADEQKYQNLVTPSRSLNFEEAQRALDQCKSLLERISATAKLGMQCFNADTEMYTGLSCFFPMVNQRLLPPTFPRKARLLSPMAAIDYLQSLVRQLLLICSSPQWAGSFSTSVGFFREFSRKENCLLSRSILQIAYNSGRNGKVLGKTAFIETVKEALREFIQPPILHPKCNLASDSQCRQMWEDFLTNCNRVLPEVVRCYGYNRARQRDRLAIVLEDLASLQEEADRLDSFLHSILTRSSQPITSPIRHHLTCLGSFILYHVLVVMLDYLLLGFELELYSMHEYAYVYWYAHELLYKWLINILHKADNFIYEQEQLISKSEKTKGEKKKKSSKKKFTKMHKIEIMHLQSRQKLCEGYYRMMLGFYSLDRVRVPSFSGDVEHECIRYEHRLSPFSHLSTPPLIGYNQFLNISNFKDIIEKVPASRLFSDAAQCFDEARLGLENIPSVDENENATLIRICKTNVVILRLLASGHRSDAKDWPIFDFQLNCNFPIVRLK